MGMLCMWCSEGHDKFQRPAHQRCSETATCCIDAMTVEGLLFTFYFISMFKIYINSERKVESVDHGSVIVNDYSNTCKIN